MSGVKLLCEDFLLSVSVVLQVESPENLLEMQMIRP